jgi:MFS family permease
MRGLTRIDEGEVLSALLAVVALRYPPRLVCVLGLFLITHAHTVAYQADQRGILHRCVPKPAAVLEHLCWGTAWAMTLAVGALGGGAVAVVAFSAALVVFALGETLLAPSQAALVNDLAPDDLRGRYNGLYTLAWTTGFAVGPVVAGMALDAGNGTTLFGGLIATCGLAALAAARLARHLPTAVHVVAMQGRVAPAPAPPG